MLQKLKNRATLFKNYLNKDVVCNVGPPVLGIEITNNCNLKCTMCPRTFKMTRPVGDMDFDLFKKIIDDGKDHLEFVWLQNYGEPLLNKDVFRMIDYCHLQGIQVGMSTNATVLTNEMAEKVIASNIEYVIFAFDGATKETYEKVRVGAKYDVVRSNILNFLKLKVEKSAKTFVVLQCIHMKATENDIADFKKDWNVAGVDAVRIRQVTYSVNRNNKDETSFVNSRRKWPCYWAWRDPHINADGTLIPCCQDVNADYALGNVKEHSVVELWNAPKMQSLRKLLSEGKYNEVPICKNCNMYQPSLPEVAGSFYLSVGTLNKLIPRLETLKSKIRY